MAVQTIRQPSDAQKIVEPTVGYTGTRPWLNFFRLIARLLDNLRLVSSITTADVTAAAAITLNPIGNSYTAAGAGYVQATAQTWVDGLTELKTDVNTLTTELQNTRTQLNLAIALVNELKAKHNSQQSAVSQG